MPRPRLLLVHEAPPAPIRFPDANATRGADTGGAGRLADHERLLEAMETMSRRMEDLARELGCLGHFADDGDSHDDDRPRAA